ncbi:Fe-S cluster assembly protein SufB, partial [candidate division KSB1 bacterium]|nr:Fe-S cluster assembly protein SufB [candidate division KSB1 bacterium]NIR71358.1 Fe-S cluster assembly protein SufB [candidate division KSB1 bacterium]NIS26248.1 Fe-S cluster assembly protein SufB [candidate division KSB1 bacterium]NIT72999.1 Fe-S cluster assembly protein SufB [candidate division KSB1 bacterium]NIU26896.1 Fe-S cluster assembly protein SufB [candidate division KSB1 bacterium]
MSSELQTIERFTKSDYKWGFTTEIDMDTAPKGLNEDTIRFISAKKNEPEWMLEWRLKAFKHWQKMREPGWS